MVGDIMLAALTFYFQSTLLLLTSSNIFISRMGYMFFVIFFSTSSSFLSIAHGNEMQMYYYSIGGKTPFYNAASFQLNTIITELNTHTFEVDIEQPAIIFINMAEVSLETYQNILNTLTDNNRFKNILLVFDNTLVTPDKIAQKKLMMERFLGFAIDGLLVTVHSDLHTGRLIFKSLPVHAISENQHLNPELSNYDYFAAADALHQYSTTSLLNTVQSIETKKKPRKSKPDFFIDENVINTDAMYHEFEVRLSQSSLSCSMKDEPNSKNLYDYCQSKAAIDLKVIIGLMRSDEDDSETSFMTSHSYEENGDTVLEMAPGKYVRISITEDGGSGAGVSLGNLKEDYYFYQTNAFRKLRLGPYADQYHVWAKTKAGVKPVIIRRKPDNMPIYFNRTEKSVLKLKANFKQKDFIGLGPPEHSAKYNQTYKNKKYLEWNNAEYTTRNTSSGTLFSIYWDRDLTTCQALFNVNSECHFTASLWDNHPIFNLHKFSPISYSSFTPNIDIIYQVPLTTVGRTEFEVGVSVIPKVIFGEVIPAALFLLSRPTGEDTSFLSLSKSFSVDWSHPVFTRKMPINLQSMRRESGCLAGDEHGNAYLINCENSASHPIYLDKIGRIYRGVNSNKCLTLHDNMRLKFNSCNSSLNQQWQFINNNLVSRFVSNRGILTIINTNYDELLAVPLDQINILNKKNDNTGEWRVDFFNYATTHPNLSYCD